MLDTDRDTDGDLDRFIDSSVMTCSDGVMDQVERALLVVSGDAASGKLVADSQVSCSAPHSCL